MPSVKINEIDQSRYIIPGATAPMVVLVPGTASFGPVWTPANPVTRTFVGANSLTSFYNTFGDSPAKKSDGVQLDDDISFEFATNLLNAGATIMFARLNDGGDVSESTVSGGNKIKAKYSGKFGNKLCVKASLVSTSGDSTDIVLTVAKDVKPADPQNITEADFNKATILESYRVSSNRDSEFYDNANKFEFIDTVTVALITAILDRFKCSHNVLSGDDAPADWDTNFTSYDTKDGNDYIPVVGVAPAYVHGDYYVTNPNGEFTLPANDPTEEEWDANYKNYYKLKEGSSTEFIHVSAVAPAYTKDTYYEKIVSSNVLFYQLTGGTDFGSGATISDITNILSGDNFYTTFKDPYLYDFDFVTSGGFVDVFDNEHIWSSIDAIHSKMIALCESRGDCLALLDTPKDMKGINDTSDGTKTVYEYASYVNTSYASIYAPWGQLVSATTGRLVDMSPSFIFMASVLNGMNTSVNNELWYVPAGVTRASLPFLIAPEYEIGSVILDNFQNKYNYRVNPIMKVRNYGYCIYGNSTCLQSQEGLSRSVLESMNVRLLCNVIKKAIFATCSGLAFEYNDTRLWAKFYAQMDKVLIYMKRNYGLYDYKIMMDNTTVTSAAMNERRVPGKVMVSPTLAGEYFDIDFEISPSGVSFTEGE